MYQVTYQYNHGSWVENCTSHWLTEDKIKGKLAHLVSKGAINIKVMMMVDVTEKFSI
jgi:hypothetical protein